MVTQNVLIIGFVWPEPNSSAAGTRMLQLIALFQNAGWGITFASAAADSEFMFDVTSLGIKKVTIKLNDTSFDEFIIKLNPTIVLFDRFMVEEQFGWRVVQHCPNAIRILDTEDLHCLRHARHKAFKEKRVYSAHDLYSDIAKREIASILRCDISLIISEVEMDLLQNHFKIDKEILFYLPFLVDEIDESIINSWPKFKERKDFVFIGNFLHEPNWNTVQYLKETIWPLIRKKLPDTNIKIYGAYPSQKVWQLNNIADGFLVLGRADNAKEIIEKARILLAPIRFGAGAKGKLLEAMQYGTPSITTTIGAESMHGSLPWSGIIADDSQQIAEAAFQLYQDQVFWETAQQRGIEIINQRFDKRLFEQNFLKKMATIQLNIEQHRKNNFIGALLNHHTIASTKYMSKWIEEKNKK